MRQKWCRINAIFCECYSNILNTEMSQDKCKIRCTLCYSSDMIRKAVLLVSICVEIRSTTEMYRLDDVKIETEAVATEKCSRQKSDGYCSI